MRRDRDEIQAIASCERTIVVSQDEAELIKKKENGKERTIEEKSSISHLIELLN